MTWEELAVLACEAWTLTYVGIEGDYVRVTNYRGDAYMLDRIVVNKWVAEYEEKRGWRICR